MWVPGDVGIRRNRLLIKLLKKRLTRNLQMMPCYFQTQKPWLPSTYIKCGRNIGIGLTIKYILTEYGAFVEVRQKYFEETSLYLLFRNVNPEKKNWIHERGIKPIRSVLWSSLCEVFWQRVVVIYVKYLNYVAEKLWLTLSGRVTKRWIEPRFQNVNPDTKFNSSKRHKLRGVL